MSFPLLNRPEQGPRLPTAQRLTFAAAALVRGLVWCFAEIFLGYYLRVRLELSAGETGLLLLVLLLLGAAGDAAAAWLLQRMGGDRGAMLRAQTTGAIVTAMAFILLFTRWSSATQFDNFVWALFWGAAFRIAYAFYAVPQLTLLSLLPADNAQMRDLTTLNSTMGAVARLAVAVAAFLITGGFAQLAEGHEELWVLVLALLIIVASFSLERVSGGAMAQSPRNPMCKPAVEPGFDTEALPRRYGWLLVSFAAHAAGLFMLTRLVLFTPGELEIGPAGPWLMLCTSAGLACGPMIGALMVRNVATAVVFPLATSAAAIAAALLSFASTPMGAKLPAAVLYGISLGASGMLLWQTAAMQVRDGARSIGRRADALAFGLISLVIKIGMAAGNGMLAFSLDGYAAGDRLQAVWLVGVSVCGAVVCIVAWQRSVADTSSGAPLVPARH